MMQDVRVAVGVQSCINISLSLQGHTAFLVGNFAEWFLAIFFNLFFFSLVPDFLDYGSRLLVRPENDPTLDPEASVRVARSVTNERTSLLKGAPSSSYA